jgi:hypothetical protein
MTRRSVLALVLAFSVVAPIGAQAPSSEAITEATIRTMTTAAIAAGKGNPDKTIDALDKAVKARWGEVYKDPAFLIASPELSAALFSPYMGYRFALKNAVRKQETTDGLPFEEDIAEIRVSPTQMGAPDIIKIVVRRGDQIIEPLTNALFAREFKNRLGAAVMIHTGTVTYPMSAFAPGADVVMTLIPERGQNIVGTMTGKALLKFK